jgi:hypothetical protein
LNRIFKTKNPLVLLALFLIAAAAAFYGKPAERVPAEQTTPAATRNSGALSSDEKIRELFEARKSGVRIEGAGKVERVLADDDDGARHQKFILRLASGQTLSVAHNIDIAPRLDGLKAGDEIEFAGEYVFNEKGGTLHWTHHAPRGDHEDGWLKWKGKIYK